MAHDLQEKDHQLAQRCIGFFISLHILLWTLIPNWARTALPMDSAEGVVWGHQLALGYDRNPWLNGWLTRLAIELGGYSDIVVYFFSQLCVGLAFWSLWRLGRKMLSPLQAVVAVLMLEAVQYYTLAAVDFNDNVLELGLWPLLILCFYNATTLQRNRDWLAAGVIAALAMMAKYYSAILLLAMLIFLIWNPKARESFKKPGVYLGTLIFLAIITPHVVWLFHHDFVTIQYALRRVQDNAQINFWSYIQPGLDFAFMQLLAFLGAIGLFTFALWGKKGAPTQNTTPLLQEAATFDVTRFNRQFLWLVGAGPYIITVALALLAGWQLHTLWGMPLLACCGLLWMFYVRPTITRARFYRFIAAALCVFAGFIGGYTYVMLKPGNTSSGNFPARTFAADINKIWHTQYQAPLSYVVGDRVLCSYVTRYSQDKPQAHLDWDIATNPWIDEQAMRRKGAIFLQRAEEGKNFPSKVLEKFPNLKIVAVQHISYVRSVPGAQPIAILVGILPPKP